MDAAYIEEESESVKVPEPSETENLSFGTGQNFARSRDYSTLTNNRNKLVKERMVILKLVFRK